MAKKIKAKRDCAVAKKLKAKYGMSEREATQDIRRHYIPHPLMRHKVRTSPSEAAGNATLGWYRGHHGGVYSAYLTLRKQFPKAANALLEAFGMDKTGAMGLE